MEYGKVLQHYMDESGVNQSELARRVGCGRSQIHDYLTGRNGEPRVTRAKKIADALGVPFEDMLEMMFNDER